MLVYFLVSGMKHMGETMKSILVIYDSQYGNTERIATVIALRLREQGIKVSFNNLKEIRLNELSQYDLLIIGGPTHSRTMSKSMKTFLEKLEDLDLKDKNAFVFDTRVEQRFAGSAGKTIEKQLKRFGLRIVKPYVSAIVKGTEGPLEEGMEEKFKQIATELAGLI